MFYFITDQLYVVKLMSLKQIIKGNYNCISLHFSRYKNAHASVVVTSEALAVVQEKFVPPTLLVLAIQEA